MLIDRQKCQVENKMTTQNKLILTFATQMALSTHPIFPIWTKEVEIGNLIKTTPIFPASKMQKNLIRRAMDPKIINSS